MVILHIVAPAQFGGLEQVVRMLTRGLSGHGHEVHVAALVGAREHEHPFLRSWQAGGVEMHPVALPWRAYLRERIETAALCQRIRPEVVHTHGYRPDVVDARVARHCGIPVVTTVHGFTGGGWKNRLYERIQRRALRRFDGVVAVSRLLAQRLERDRVPRDRIEVIPNAWEALDNPLPRETARRTLGVPLDRLHVGWVGRLTPEKGADVMIDALAYLTDLPVVVSFVGDGPHRARLRKRATALGLDGRVLWHGAIRDAARLLSALDVFVLSSRTEGTPIALFEAMAAGVPVVATAVGGVPDVVSGAEALLVPVHDPVALAQAIRAVVLAPKTALARATTARGRLERDFAPGPWVARYEAVYRRVVAA